MMSRVRIVDIEDKVLIRRGVLSMNLTRYVDSQGKNYFQYRQNKDGIQPNDVVDIGWYWDKSYDTGRIKLIKELKKVTLTT
jgi:hypothetical protein